MANLLEKVGILISANLHWLANQALEANSLAVVDEYIRRVEDNIDALEDATATIGGRAVPANGQASGGIPDLS